MVRTVIAALLLVLFCHPWGAGFAATEPSPAPPRTQTPAQPEAQVILDGAPLFVIRAGALSFSPAERAGAVSRRLARLVKSPLFRPDSIKVVDSDITSDIFSGDTILMSVTEADAQAAGLTRPVLARELGARIRTVVEARHEAFGMHGILISGLYAAAATLALLAILFLLHHYLPRIIARIRAWQGTRIHSLRFQKIEILHEGRIVALLVTFVRWLRTLLVLGLLYLYVPLVFSFFPQTQGVAATLFDYIVTPLEKVGHAAVTSLPNIFFIVVITVITNYVITFARFIFSEVEKGTVTLPGFYADWAVPSFKIARFLIIAFAVVVAFPYLPGSSSAAFKGVSVFLGVLFSLGSSSAVANVVAGVILTYTRAFKLGDRVQIADTVGDVVEKTLLVTRVRTIKNVDVTVPNAMVLGSHIINFSSSAHAYGLILNTSVTIGYDAPWRQVHELLIAAAHATENVLELPEPFVLQTSLDDFYVSYQINAYTDKPAVMARTYSDLHQNIQDRFNEAGVEIMSPHYSSLRDGNQTAIPTSYLPGDYLPPVFGVRSVPRR